MTRYRFVYTLSESGLVLFDFMHSTASAVTDATRANPETAHIGAAISKPTQLKHATFPDKQIPPKTAAKHEITKMDTAAIIPIVTNQLRPSGSPSLPRLRPSPPVFSVCDDASNCESICSDCGNVASGRSVPDNCKRLPSGNTSAPSFFSECRQLSGSTGGGSDGGGGGNPGRGGSDGGGGRKHGADDRGGGGGGSGSEKSCGSDPGGSDKCDGTTTGRSLGFGADDGG